MLEMLLIFLCLDPSLIPDIIIGRDAHSVMLIKDDSLSDL